MSKTDENKDVLVAQLDSASSRAMIAENELMQCRDALAIATQKQASMADQLAASATTISRLEAALAKAADEDKNGVIQWGEWYCVSDAIISAVKMAKAQNSK